MFIVNDVHYKNKGCVYVFLRPKSLPSVLSSAERRQKNALLSQHSKTQTLFTSKKRFI